MNETTVSDDKGLPGNGRNGNTKEFLANSQPGCWILLREEFQAVVKRLDGISSRTPPQPLRVDVGLSDRLSGATAWPEAAWTLLTFNVARASSTLSPPSDQDHRDGFTWLLKYRTTKTTGQKNVLSDQVKQPKLHPPPAVHVCGLTPHTATYWPVPVTTDEREREDRERKPREEEEEAEALTLMMVSSSPKLGVHGGAPGPPD